jgi:hypothetical protein
MELPVFEPPSQVLPPLYAGWMQELLELPIPPETEATCADCAMCAGESKENPPVGYYFNPRTKCCTFIPVLPNFLVGQALLDADPASAAGRATLERRLASGVAVTPLGLGRDPTYQLLYQHSAAAAGFGRNQSIRCPHYLEDQGGACGIWRHRESVCATWFCKHVRGATGREFWVALQHLLGRIEIELAQWCVLELDIGPEATGRLFGAPALSSDGDPIKEGRLDGIPDAAVQEANWGHWAGRERAFYEECSRRVAALDWSGVTAICGQGVRAAAQLAVDAFARLTARDLPPRLRAAKFRLLPTRTGTGRVETYSSCDPLNVPKVVLDVLHCFDGRPVGQVLQSIAMERGIHIEESLVRKLVDFRILIPCPQ